jgi:hypothetical protein
MRQRDFHSKPPTFNGCESRRTTQVGLGGTRVDTPDEMATGVYELWTSNQGVCKPEVFVAACAVALVGS